MAVGSRREEGDWARMGERSSGQAKAQLQLVMVVVVVMVVVMVMVMVMVMAVLVVMVMAVLVFVVVMLMVMMAGLVMQFVAHVRVWSEFSRQCREQVSASKPDTMSTKII